MGKTRSAKVRKAFAPRKPKLCEICHIKTTDIGRHLKLHASNRQSLMIRCSFAKCPFSNLQASNVVEHYIAKHTNLTPYECVYLLRDTGAKCSQSFGSRNSLSAHEEQDHKGHLKGRGKRRASILSDFRKWFIRPSREQDGSSQGLLASSGEEQGSPYSSSSPVLASTSSTPTPQREESPTPVVIQPHSIPPASASHGSLVPNRSALAHPSLRSLFASRSLLQRGISANSKPWISIGDVNGMNAQGAQ